MKANALIYAGALSISVVAHADVTIDTTTASFWDGSNAFGSLGEGGVALGSFGQTVQVPVGFNRLASFSFELNPDLESSSTRLKLYVFNWDSVNLHATGSPLYTSSTFSSLGNSWQSVGVAGVNLDLLEGADIILVASSEEVLDSTDDSADMGVATSGPVDAYGSGAAFVLGPGGGDLTHLTDTPWGKFNTSNSDFAFTANFVEGVAPVPEASAWHGMAALGAIFGAAVLRRRLA